MAIIITTTNMVIMVTTCTMVTKFTIDFLVALVTSTNTVNVVTTATMVTMVCVATRTRNLLHCHLTDSVAPLHGVPGHLPVPATS